MKTSEFKCFAFIIGNALKSTALDELKTQPSLYCMITVLFGFYTKVLNPKYQAFKIAHSESVSFKLDQTTALAIKGICEDFTVFSFIDPNTYEGSIFQDMYRLIDQQFIA